MKGVSFLTDETHKRRYVQLDLGMLARVAESDLKQLLELVMAEARKEGSKRQMHAKSNAAENVSKADITEKSTDSLEAFLLTAPTFTRKQISEIENARNEIAKWRQN